LKQNVSLHDRQFYEGGHENGIYCTEGLKSLLNVLHQLTEDVHSKIIEKINIIHAFLPRDIISSQSYRPNRGLFDGIGKFFKYVIGSATNDDVLALSKRLKNLEVYIGTADRNSRLDLKRLLTGEKLLAHRVDLLYNEMKEATLSLTKQFEFRLNTLSLELEWIHILVAKSVSIIHKSTSIMESLDNLYRGLQMLDHGMLSPDLIPTESFQNMITFIEFQLEHNGTIPLCIVPTSAPQLHKIITTFYAKIQDNLLVSINVPLTSFASKFQFYKLESYNIKIPNSNLSSIIDINVQYVGIDSTTNNYVLVTDYQAFQIAASSSYILRNPQVYQDGPSTCIIALYTNNKQKVQLYCKYVIDPIILTSQVSQIGKYQYFLQNTKNYAITCQSTLHHNNSSPISKTVSYSCSIDCIIDVSQFNSTDMGVDLTDMNRFEGLSCFLSTDKFQISFSLDNSVSNQKLNTITQFPINLMVISRYYNEQALKDLDGSTSFEAVPVLHIPSINVQYSEHDGPIRLELNRVLNMSIANEDIYAHLWRDPLTYMSDNVNDWLFIGVNFLLIAGVIFLGIYHHFRLRKVYTLLLVLQAASHRPVNALGGLILTTTLPVTKVAAMTYHEVVIKLGAGYWLHVLVIAILILVLYKGAIQLSTYWPSNIDTGNTMSQLVLQLRSGVDSVYVALLEVDGVPEHLIIRTSTSIENIQVLGVVRPVLHYFWPLLVINDITGVTSVLNSTVLLTYSQARVVRRILASHYTTYLYLKHGNTVQMGCSSTQPAPSDTLMEPISPGCTRAMIIVPPV